MLSNFKKRSTGIENIGCRSGICAPSRAYGQPLRRHMTKAEIIAMTLKGNESDPA
jgi:hypothetical protein